MNIPEAVLKFMNDFHLLEDAAIEEIQFMIKKVHVPKKEFLLERGEVCKNFYLIEKGVVRYYFREDDQSHTSWFSKELTTWFAKENDVVIEIASFIDQAPSRAWIEALEDCELYYLSFEETMMLMKKYHSCSIFANMLLLYYLKQFSDRSILYQRKAAQDRYNELLEYSSELFLRVPLVYLASYLGVTPETLSRMRSVKKK